MSKPDLKLWKFLKQYLLQYDASIFSIAKFSRVLPHPQYLVAPSIDPLSDKNRELSKEEIDKVVSSFQINLDKPIILQVSRFDRFKGPLGVKMCIRDRNKPAQADIDAARMGLHEIKEIILSGKYDVVVLDEANIALFYGLFSVQELIDIITQKPKETEIVITGRYAPPELIEVADLVTEMKEIKHYYTKGLEARSGIEH